MGKMGILHDIRTGIKRLGPSQNELAKKVGASQSAVSRFMGGEAGMRADSLTKILDYLGAKIVFPDEIHDTTKDVCFVAAHQVGINGEAPPIPPENYMAVPLARGSVAAGPGMIPEDSVRGWVLALKNHPSIQFRKNLVAVEIGEGQESMVPTLHPRDIVLVDKDDVRPQPEGSIFLIREPGHDADVAIKRVYVQRRDGEVSLQFVSDNPDRRTYPPMTYSLGRDYDGDLNRAIVGRVVWSWSDMTRK